MIVVGIDPTKLFPNSFRTASFTHDMSEMGIEPVRLFEFALNASNRASCPRPVGSDPFSALFPNPSSKMFDNPLSAEGMGPVKPLLSSRKKMSPLRSPTVLGIDEKNLFKLRSRVDSVIIWPIDCGIVPVKFV